MILPGVQALFGFQLIAIFSATFEKIPFALRVMHLTALLAVTLSMILLLTPATYHRIRMPETEEEWFIEFGSKFMVASLLPLGLALVLDIFVLVQLVGSRWWLSATAAGLIALICLLLWLVLPRMHRRTRRTRR